MKEKKNELWKLDLLETKYTKATPRFSFTRKLLNARNNSHVIKKLPSTPNEALQQIHALKADLFRKKWHGAYKKLSREVSRATKQRTLGEKEKHLESLWTPTFLDQLITAKLVKLVSAAVLTTKETRSSPPAYISQEVRTYISDKTQAKNPSRFFVSYCQNDKVLNDYLSKLWNQKDTKELCSEIDWTFRKIRGNLTKTELAARSKETGNNTRDVAARGERDDSGDSDSDSDDSDSGSENDAEAARDKFAAFDHMVAGSDEEEENESSSDSENEPRSGKTEHALPQLATGYYSGGSDDESDIDNDKVVREATTARKNRRGQRARQKIWEQKYGPKAVHVQKEHVRLASERERKQQEFEERQRKRELKEKVAREKNTSKTAGSVSADSSVASMVHPSWEAKKLAEEKMKNVKFEGKKITFD